MSPPMIAESMLRQLIADPELEHAVLGDLAESWADYANSSGIHEANRWYWCQAFMTAPHLVLACWRDRYKGGVRGTARAVGAGFLSMAVLTSSGDVLLEGVFGVAPEKLSAVGLVARLVVGAAIGLGSGATTAWASRRIPLVNGLAFAAAYLALAALAAIAVGGTVSAPYWASLSMIVPGSFIVGRMSDSLGAA